jgi:uncharacterized protein YndB with AHSA1/START domain
MHDLEVERRIEAAPARVFDAFIAVYDDDRPSWVVASELDLRVGGAWSVTFHPPGVEPFREERVITRLERPELLAYEMTAIGAGGRPSFDADVELSLEDHGSWTRARLVQHGFPTPDVRDEFAAAWPDVLDLLARRVED